MEETKITRSMIESVANRVGLPLDLWEQDWYLEMVTAEDAARLIAAYNSFTDPVDKSVLMWFVISAYDEYLGECAFHKIAPDDQLEKMLTKQLHDNWAEHWDAVKYWSCLDNGEDGGPEEDEADCFPVTPIMRMLWREHEHKATKRN